MAGGKRRRKKHKPEAVTNGSNDIVETNNSDGKKSDFHVNGTCDDPQGSVTTPHHQSHEKQKGQQNKNQQRPDNGRNHSGQYNNVKQRHNNKQEALDLSQQLRTLSNRKQLQEALRLYYSPSNDDIRDAHHGSIVIDCCARCGNILEAERIITDMTKGGALGSGQIPATGNMNDDAKKKDETKRRPFFWEAAVETNRIAAMSNRASSSRRAMTVPIQAWTALLKGYAHGGHMVKADALFRFLCRRAAHIADTRKNARGNKRKWSSSNNSGQFYGETAPNVRTLNTLLRGCLWTAASLYSSYFTSKYSDQSGDEQNLQLAGGVVTAERAWSLCQSQVQNSNDVHDRNDNETNALTIDADSSSYEYTITLLCQALRCHEAEARLQQMKRAFGINNSTGRTYQNVDKSILESLVVCLVALSRGYIMSGNLEKTKIFVEQALSIVDFLQSFTDSGKTTLDNDGHEGAKSGVAIGGKRSWRNSFNNNVNDASNNSNGDDSGDGNRINSRREQSNHLFRMHRLSELCLEARSLQSLCDDGCESQSQQRQQQKNQTKSKPQCQKQIMTKDAKYLARWMMTRLFYFSGGGTTSLDANDGVDSQSGDNGDDEHEISNKMIYNQWMHSLWHNFGLKETTIRIQKTDDSFLDASLSQLSSLPKKHEMKHNNSKRKKNKEQNSHHRPEDSAAKGHLFQCDILSDDFCDSLRNKILGENRELLSNDGCIDFSQAFSSIDYHDTHTNGKITSCSLSSKTSAIINEEAKNSKKLHIELGAGSGDWIALQARLNPNDNYVTVELRADRVAQTFSKCFLHCNSPDGNNAPLSNVCCVGAECGSFLRHRVKEGTVRTIFVNHPEPPTQTFELSAENTTFGVIANGADFKSNGMDIATSKEPAHMLHSHTIRLAARCLERHGKGRLIIVTDNLIYARLICRTLVRVLCQENLLGVSPREVPDLKKIDSFDVSGVNSANHQFKGQKKGGKHWTRHGNRSGDYLHLYEGKPSLSIGHYTSPQGGDGSIRGTSYFDRLWRTGAGKHAEMKKRYIIAVRTRGRENDGGTGQEGRNFPTNLPSHPSRGHPSRNSAAKSANCEKPRKKRSAEKQRLRNERRLMKKQKQDQKIQQENK